MVDSHLVEEEDEVELGQVEVMLDEVVVEVDSPGMVVEVTEVVVVDMEEVVVDSEVEEDSVVEVVVDSLPPLQEVLVGGRCR